MSDLVRLFVGNISYNLTEAGLTDELSKLGVVAENVKIARDKDTRGAKGFGFFEVESSDAERVIKVTDGAPVGGRFLKVERAVRQPADDLARRRPPPQRREFVEQTDHSAAWREEMRGSNSKRRHHR